MTTRTPPRSGYPSLVLLFDVPASGLDSGFNPLPACGGDSLAVEEDQRHLRYCTRAGNRCLPISALNPPSKIRVLFLYPGETECSSSGSTYRSG
jgi:hypothetical protein